jgi:hypothetical protein
MPLWLKILILLIVASVVFSALGAISEFVILPLLFLGLMLFPGSNQKNPTFFKVMPYIWALNLLAAIAMLIAQWAGKSRALLGTEGRMPTSVELWSTIAFTPLLMWSFLKRHASFKPILIATSLAFIGIEIWIFVYDSVRDVSAIFELVGSLVAEGMLLGYFLLKYVPVKEPRR